MSCLCTSCACAADSACPEVVPVTINEYTLEFNAESVVMTVANTDPVDATKKAISVQVGAAGYYSGRFWFVDAGDPSDEKSVISPTVPGVSEFTLVSDATGLFEFNVENTGVLRTWYLCVEICGVVQISEAITIGA